MVWFPAQLAEQKSSYQVPEEETKLTAINGNLFAKKIKLKAKHISCVEEDNSIISTFFLCVKTIIIIINCWLMY